jgi:hypothetical protein
MDIIRHNEIMDKLKLIENKHIILKNSYVIIDKHFVCDVIMYSCFAFAIIGLGIRFIYI